MLKFIAQPVFSQYVIAVLFVLAGIMHFIKPGMYVRIMPDYIPKHQLMVYISGVAEILGGLGLLISQTKSLAAWGIILLLVVFLTVHVDMPIEAYKNRGGTSFYFIATLIRLPLQFLLIWWVYWACIQH